MSNTVRNLAYRYKRKEKLEAVEAISKQLFSLHRHLVGCQCDKTHETLTTIQTMLDYIRE